MTDKILHLAIVKMSVQTSTIKPLPNEIWLKIFRHLQRRELSRCRHVCHTFQNLILYQKRMSEIARVTEPKVGDFLRPTYWMGNMYEHEIKEIVRSFKKYLQSDNQVPQLSSAKLQQFLKLLMKGRYAKITMVEPIKKARPDSPTHVIIAHLEPSILPDLTYIRRLIMDLAFGHSFKQRLEIANLCGDLCTSFKLKGKDVKLFIRKSRTNIPLNWFYPSYQTQKQVEMSEKTTDALFDKLMHELQKEVVEYQTYLQVPSTDNT